MVNFFEGVLIVIIVLMGLWIWYLLKNKKESEREATALTKEKDEYAELGQGLTEYNQKLQEKKEQAEQKILELIKSKGKISNRDAVKALNFSSATIRRYFDDLEAENKVKQVGKVGQQVFYEVI